MSISVHAQGIKTVHTEVGEGVKKWQNSVHVVVECPLMLGYLSTSPTSDELDQLPLLHHQSFISLRSWRASLMRETVLIDFS